MKLIKYCIVFAVAISLFLSNGVAAQSDVSGRVKQYYKFESWKKSDRQPLLGLKLDEFEINGFKLKEKRFHAPTGGREYIWFDETSNVSLHVIVNVYSSADEAREKFLAWLTMGVNILLQKGTFSSSSNVIGDISWVDSNSSLLAFLRDNVLIIMHGRAKVASDRLLIENIATNLDMTITDLYRPSDGVRSVQMARPIIESLKLKKTKLKINEATLITIEARDPRGEKLDYNFHATGGNILKTKQGYMYQALKPGEHTITVFVTDNSNLRSEKTISVIVVK